MSESALRFRRLARVAIGLLGVYFLITGIATSGSQLGEVYEGLHRRDDPFSYFQEPGLALSISAPYLLGYVLPGLVLLTFRRRRRSP